MKILFLTDTLSVGGAERSYLSLLRELVDHDINIAPYILEDSDFKIDETKIKISCLRPEFTKNNLLKFLYLFKDALYFKKITKRDNYDIIISFQKRSNFTIILSKIISRNKITKYIISERAYNPKPSIYSFKKNIIRVFKKIIYRRADYVTCNGFEMKESLNNFAAIPLNKIFVIPNGYDINKIKTLAREDVLEQDQFIFKNNKKTLINIGRLYSQKRQDFLIEIVRQLPELYQMVILGEGPKRNYLQDLISKYKLNHRVYLLGTRSNPFPYLRLSDVFVFSSTHEGYPNAVAEALICDKPVVSTYFKSGLKELIIDSNAGACVAENDHDGFIKAVLEEKNTSGSAKFLSGDDTAGMYINLFKNVTAKNK